MARTVSAPRLAILNGQHVNFFVRVEVENADGGWTDLTNLFGFDFVDGGGWTENIDQPVSSGTIDLARAHRAADGTLYSLAPTVAGSPLNRKADGTYGRLLRAGRKIRVFWNWTAPDVAPAVGDWLEVFLGRVDEVDWKGKPNAVQLAIRDAGGWLQEKWVEEETEYADDAGVPVETVMQQILDQWQEPRLGPVALYVPVSPGWNVRKFKQERKSVLDALRDLALQIGWDVRYKWDDATGLYRLTFYQPDRAKAVADWTLGPDQYFDVSQLKEGDANVRNRVKATATDAATGAQLVSVKENVASQGEFGVKFMEVDEDATSNIDTQAELDAMATAMVSDLGDIRADQEVENLFYPIAEIGDLGKWLANGEHYDADELLAVVQVRHEFSRDKRRSFIQTRGQVAGAYYEWIRRQGTGGNAPGSDASTLALKNWREISRTKDDITFGFEASEGTAKIALFQFTQAVDQAVIWPGEPGGMKVPKWLTPDTTTITVAFPASGNVTYLQVQPANAALEFGEFVRQRVFAVGTPPQVENEAQEVSISGLYTAMSFDVTDAQGLGGTLRAWVNSGSEDSANSSAAPDGTVTVAATPAHISGGTVFTKGDGTTDTILANIPVHPGRGKRVYVEYTNTLGVSSGVISINLLSQGGIIDANGNLIDGAIKAASQFAAAIAPVQVLAALPASAPDNTLVFLTTDGQLYRRIGGAWTLEVKAPNISGQLVTTQIADAAINTAKFAAGIKPVELLASTTGAPGVNRIALNTADGKLYRSSPDGTAWVSAVPAVDISGQLIAGQIADAAITTAKFAAGIRPVRIVSALPGAGDTAGDTVFLTTDNKLYRWTGAAWTKAVDGGDIVAGSIVAGKIAAGAISTTELAANAVTAAKIAAGTITSNEVAANTITGGNIAGATITGTNIAATTITSGLLASSSVIAGKIAAGAVSTTELAANAVTAAKIAAGTITANEIAAATITGSNIAGSTIAGTNIVGGTISAVHLSSNSITAGKIAAGAINSSTLFVSGVVTATVISVSNLAAISSALGIIVSGRLNSANGHSYLDLSATGASPFLHHEDGLGNTTIELLANGSATFYGTVASTTFTGSGAVFSNGLSVGSGSNLFIASGSLVLGSSGLTSPTISTSGGDLMLAGSHSGTTYTGGVRRALTGGGSGPMPVVLVTGGAPGSGGNYRSGDFAVDTTGPHLYYNDGSGNWVFII